MKIPELIKQCHADDVVTLRLPPPNEPGFNRRLLDGAGPIGHILCGGEKGQLVRFKSVDILRFLDRY